MSKTPSKRVQSSREAKDWGMGVGQEPRRTQTSISGGCRKRDSSLEPLAGTNSADQILWFQASDPQAGEN